MIGWSLLARRALEDEAEVVEAGLVESWRRAERAKRR
jgi:hypothetical protein